MEHRLDAYLDKEDRDHAEYDAYLQSSEGQAVIDTCSCGTLLYEGDNNYTAPDGLPFCSEECWSEFASDQYTS